MAKDAGGARTNSHLTKDELFTKLAVPEGDYELPTGGTIRIRGLDINEGLVALQEAGDDASARLKRICLLGIIEPKLEPEDLERIGVSSADLVSDIALAIIRLSGMLPEQVSDFLANTPQPSPSSSTARRRSTGSRRR